jgi:phosphatidylinositol-3-phosphatase
MKVRTALTLLLLTAPAVAATVWSGGASGARKDKLPPTVPTAFHTTAKTTTSVTTAWQASTDNVGVRGYNLYRQGTLVSSTSTTSYTFSGLTCQTSYSFAVEAFDVAGNLSGRSTLNDTTSPCSSPCGAKAGQPSTLTKVVWIWFENHPATSITATAAPYFNQIKNQCGYPSNFNAITHPSLPNYIAATSGSTQGITDDNPPSSHPLNVSNIYRQMETAGKKWASLQESMISNCPKVNQGQYAVRHDPAAYYTNLTQCSTSDRPLTSTPDFSADFTFVMPNLCNSMHDCSVTTGDNWLKGFLPKAIASPAYQAGQTAIIITFDEGNADQRVFTLVLSPFTRAGAVASTAFNHYSLLRTTEEITGVPCLASACSANSMRSAFGL